MISTLDADVVSRWAPFRSLDPTRDRARTPGEIAARLVRAGDPPELGEAVRTGLFEIIEAIGAAFPGNLFWDLDYLGACLLGPADPTQAVADRSQRVLGVAAHARQVAALQGLFGGRTNIRFRYVHDFLYGFDWAKWVAAGPRERAGVGPFSLQFADRMMARGRQLVRTIATRQDAKYPPLGAGHDRNPFGFRRDPEAELTLLRALAESDGIPVASWRIDATPRWNFPFAERRSELAARLGLGR